VGTKDRRAGCENLGVALGSRARCWGRVELEVLPRPRGLLGSWEPLAEPETT
jgi:hypothetical protein